VSHRNSTEPTIS